MESFPLSSDQCEILMAFEQTGSLTKLAEHLHRDVSAVSRQLARIHEAGPFLEKQQGKWCLTPIGKQVCSHARDYTHRLKLLMKQRTSLRIGTTREFAARILCGDLDEVLGAEERERLDLSIVSAEEGTEALLLGGAIDIGIDCGRPNDPLIRYRHVNRESFVIVAAPSLTRGKGAIESLDGLLTLPNLEYTRVKTSKYLEIPQDIPTTVCRFNDLAALRTACVAGYGWAVVPAYTVRDELKSKRLIALAPKIKIRSDHFGVWWLRSNAAMAPVIERITHWLKKQPL